MRRLTCACACALWLLCATSARAQDEAQGEEPEATLGARADEPEATLGVSTVASSLEPEALTTPEPAASEARFTAERLRIVPRPHADAWLTLSPGLVRASHGGLWHASSLFLRGFDAGEGLAFAGSVEGVPLNEPSNAHGHGYLDLGLIIPEAIGDVRVAQGSFRPEQTDFSVAGSAEYTLGPSRRGAFGALGLGRFRAQRLLVGWSAPETSASRDADASFFVLAAERGDGFGPNRAHQSVRANARVVHAIDAERRITLFVASQAQRHDSAGVVRVDAFEARTLPCASEARAQLDCVVDPRQGGSGQRHVVSLGYSDASLRALVHAGVRRARFRDDFTGEVLDARGDGVEATYDTFTLGSTGSYTHGLPLDGLALRVGWDLRHDRGTTRMARLRRADGIPYESVFDTALSLSRIGAFAASTLSHARPSGMRIFASLSLRADAYASALEQRGLPTSDREGERLPRATTDALGFALQPRGYLALTSRSGFGGHVAMGTGARSSDAQTLAEGERSALTRLVTSELGLGYALGEREHPRLRASAVAFHTYVENDLVFDPNRARSVSVGRTRRYGATFALDYDERFGGEHAHALVSRASLGLADARFVDPGRSVLDTRSGDAVPFVPRATGRVDIAYRGALREGRLRFDAGLGASFVGREPLPLGERGQGYALLDAGAALGFRYVELRVDVENLANAGYRSMELFHLADFGGYDGLPSGNRLPTRLYAAGAPRTFMITLRVGAEP